MPRISRRIPFSGWPSWRYGPGGEAKIFNAAHEVPEGWTRKPFVPDVAIETVPVVYYDREEIIAKLQELNIPFSHARATSYLASLIP